MKNLVIIGAGPRGLAVALRASLHSNIKVTLVDIAPLSTWTFPRMLSDIQMRSPISFDLTTFCLDLKDYSLSRFLGYNFNFTTQEEVEACNLFCNRKNFVYYLKFICNQLQKNGVVFAKQEAVNIGDSVVECASGIKLPYDYLVMATGRRTQEEKIPAYLKNKDFVTTQTLHDHTWTNRYINVIGSGQQSAELVEFLARQKAKVTWIQKHQPKVTQYPAPSIKDWGYRSALGSYYKEMCRNQSRYLIEVKQWAPSITPYINSKLERLPYTILVNPTNTNKINLDADFIIATGFTQKVELLSHDFNLKRNPFDNNLPAIDKDFRSISHPNVFFTGMLALRYDGPRQGSVISSGLTARFIVNRVLS